MKKGFTLVELLAVVVILAIIAMIAIPIIMNIIEESRRNAAVASADGYIRAVNYKIAQEGIDGNIIPLGEYIIGENELDVDADNKERITGAYEIGEKGVLTAGLCIDNYSIEYSSGKAYYKKDGNYCAGEYVFTEPEAQILSTLCEGEDGNSKYSSSNKFKIKTVEDLVCLSNLVNDGKNFSGKEVYLLSNLDINNTGSYKDSTSKRYGDINGNGTVEELYTELTTGGGFRPIGTESKPFSGTFLGYAYTISNLMVNRTTDFAGLFGYSSGTIKGVVLDAVNIKGRNYTAGLVGFNNKGLIRSNIVRGTIVGNNSVGGILGTAPSSSPASPVDNVVFTGSITGNDGIGGLIGYDNFIELKGLVYDATIKSTSTGKISIGKIAGSINSSVNPIGKVSNVTLIFSQRYGYGSDGDNYRTSEAGMLVYDDVLDTIIGGDNDEDGYYFDYNSNGDLILYSTERKPIQNKLKGEGTEDKPYLIRNASDWRLASATVTQNSYYSVVNDIDFTGKNYYPLGTTTNKFNGHINGNMHTISNVTVGGYKNVGLIGYNTGTIEGFKFDNITISASNECSGIVGYNNGGTVKGIVATNLAITGANYTGSIVGFTNKGVIRSAIAKGNITGNNGVGGILGGAPSTSGNSPVDNVVFTGSITANDSLGGLMGYNSFVDLKGLVYDTTIKSSNTGKLNIGKITGGINGGTNVGRVSNVSLTFSQRYGYGSDGDNYRAADAGMLVYDDVLDTYIGGDNDSDGYYFDYDNSGDLTIYSTAETPIENKLKGEGTAANPYKIASVNDWKMATSLATQSKYFSVTSNIDFTDVKYYPLGTTSNKFNGTINGNMHTISNINVGGYKNVGVFGYSTGTIEGFKFNNIVVSASNERSGIIGTNDHGTVKGIIGDSITVNGVNFAGGLVGYTDKGTITEALVKGTITGNNNVGGILGGSPSTSGNSPVNNIAFSGNITGSDSLGGLMGYDSHVELKGFVFNSSIVSTNTGKINIGKITGGINSTASPVGKVYNVSISYSQRYGYGSDGTNISEITTANVASVLDTTDSDSDGYYFTVTDGSLQLLHTN